MAGIDIQSTRDMWENNLPRFPRKTAVIDGDVSLSYAEADGRIERLRTAFATRKKKARQLPGFQRQGRLASLAG